MSEPTSRRTYVGSLRDCVWTYLEVDKKARPNVLILADVDVPVAGGRTSKVLEMPEIEWLIDRLGSDVFLPPARSGRWL